MISQAPPDNRTLDEKFKDMVSKYPINTYLKTNERGSKNYYWIYGYTVSRNKYLYKKVLSLRINDETFDVNPDAILCDSDIENSTIITKEEFENVENKLNEILLTIGTKVNTDFKIYKSCLKEHKIHLNSDPISYLELLPSDKYLYVTASGHAYRLGEVISKKHSDLYTYEYDTNQRQLTISCDKYTSSNPEENKFLVLISDLKPWNLNDPMSKYYILSNDEWSKINEMFDEIKEELNKLKNI